MARDAGTESPAPLSTLAVYDCMLFFRAASRPHRVQPLFELVDQGRVALCLSAEVVAEIRDVLTRPKLLSKYPALTTQAVDSFVARYVAIARWVDNVSEHYVLARDPKDSKYVNLAIEAGSSHLVTTDLDLLDLMEPTSTAGQDFRSRFPGLQIVTPPAFLAVVAQSSP
jgi:putative PIN family toxin of toxin-antitoxin system